MTVGKNGSEKVSVEQTTTSPISSSFLSRALTYFFGDAKGSTLSIFTPIEPDPSKAEANKKLRKDIFSSICSTFSIPSFSFPSTFKSTAMLQADALDIIFDPEAFQEEQAAAAARVEEFSPKMDATLTEADKFSNGTDTRSALATIISKFLASLKHTPNKSNSSTDDTSTLRELTGESVDNFNAEPNSEIHLV